MLDVNTAALLTFASVAMGCFAAPSLIHRYALRRQQLVRARLASLVLDSETAASPLLKDAATLDDADADGGNKLSYRLQTAIDQAGFDLTAESLVLTSVGLAATAGFAGYLFAWWAGVLLALLAGALPTLVIALQRARRLRLLRRQLPEAFAMISRAVKAGHTVQAALNIVAKEFPAPISSEFNLCYEQQNLGVSRESALRALVRRTGIIELQIFVVALLVQARSGGDLAELLDNLATMMRKRVRLKERIQSLTGEGRMQAIALIVLPCAVFFGLLSLAPDYAQELLNRPWLLVATGVAQLGGALWIHRIVQLDL